FAREVAAFDDRHLRHRGLDAAVGRGGDDDVAACHVGAPDADARAIDAGLALQVRDRVADVEHLRLGQQALAADAHPGGVLREAQPVVPPDRIDQVQDPAALAPPAIVDRHRHQAAAGETRGVLLDRRFGLAPARGEHDRRRFARWRQSSRQKDPAEARDALAEEPDVAREHAVGERRLRRLRGDHHRQQARERDRRRVVHRATCADAVVAFGPGAPRYFRNQSAASVEPTSKPVYEYAWKWVSSGKTIVCALTPRSARYLVAAIAPAPPRPESSSFSAGRYST